MSPSPEKVRGEGPTAAEMEAKVAVKDFLHNFKEHLALIKGQEISVCGFLLDGSEEQCVHPVVLVGTVFYIAGAKNFSSLFRLQPGADKKAHIDWGGEIGEESYQQFDKDQFWPLAEKGRPSLSFKVEEEKVKRGLVTVETENANEFDYACEMEGSFIALSQGLARAAGAKSLAEIEFKK